MGQSITISEEVSSGESASRLIAVESLVLELAKHYGLNPEKHKIIARILEEIRA
jgi:hypothetical protein